MPATTHRRWHVLQDSKLDSIDVEEEHLFDFDCIQFPDVVYVPNRGGCFSPSDVNENKRVVKERHENKKVDGVIASIIAMNEYYHCQLNDDDIMLEIFNL